MTKINFFQNLNFRQVLLPKHVCLGINHWLLLIKMHWSYFKYNDLHTLNVYKITRKEHHEVDFCVTDEVSAPEIMLWKYLEYVP